MNDALVGVIRRRGLGLTVNVTETVCGELEAPGDVIVMDPLQTACWVRPVTLAPTLKFAGVEPLCGLTTNQFPQDVVAGLAVKKIGLPPLLTERLVCAGEDCPIW